MAEFQTNKINTTFKTFVDKYIDYVEDKSVRKNPDTAYNSYTVEKEFWIKLYNMLENFSESCMEIYEKNAEISKHMAKLETKSKVQFKKYSPDIGIQLYYSGKLIDGTLRKEIKKTNQHHPQNIGFH